MSAARRIGLVVTATLAFTACGDTIRKPVDAGDAPTIPDFAIKLDLPDDMGGVYRDAAPDAGGTPTDARPDASTTRPDAVDAMGNDVSDKDAVSNHAAPKDGADAQAKDAGLDDDAGSADVRDAAAGDTATGDDAVAFDSDRVARLTVTPDTAVFHMGIGVTTLATFFTLKNVGTAPSGAITVAITGQDSTTFELEGNTCTGALAADETCAIGVKFKAPRTAGDYKASLDITADGIEGGAFSASLTGHAYPPPAEHVGVVDAAPGIGG